MSNPFRLAYLEELSKKQKKIDKNHNGKIDGQDLQILRKEEKQDQTKNAPDNAKALGKGGKVESKKYSWGTMKTVHHGADFSIPLHPEHHQEIAKLKDQQEHKFKDETGHHWTAKKMGDNIHFQGANGGGTTHVPAHTMKEDVTSPKHYGGKGTEGAKFDLYMQKRKQKNNAQSPISPVKEQTLLSRIAEAAKKKACSECGEMKCGCMNEQAPVAPVPPNKKEQMKPRVGHPTAYASKKKTNEEVEQIDELTAAEISKLHSDAASHLKKSIDKQSDDRIAALKNPPKKKSFLQRVKGAWHGLTKEEVELQEANHREFASQGKMHPDMAKHMSVGDEHDYYEHGTGDKVSGKVMHKSDTEVHMKQTHDSYDPKKKGTVHKFKVTDKLDEDVISEEGYTLQSKKTNADGTTTVMLKSPNGKIVKHTGKNIGAAVKAKYGVDAGIQEATVSDEPTTKEKSLEQYADDFADRAGMDPHYREIRRRQFLAMVGKDATTSVDPKTGIVQKNKMNPLQPMTGSNKNTNEETMKLNSFKSYMQEGLDEAMWPGTPEYKAKYGHTDLKKGESRKSASGTGTITGTGNGSYKHERDYEKAEKETSTPEGQEKRGRGRPKGAASGARQKGSAAKSDDDRYDSTGYKLHLPK